MTCMNAFFFVGLVYKLWKLIYTEDISNDFVIYTTILFSSNVEGRLRSGWLFEKGSNKIMMNRNVVVFTFLNIISDVSVMTL